MATKPKVQPRKKSQSRKNVKNSVIASGKAKWYTGKGMIVAAAVLVFVVAAGLFGIKLYQQSGAHAAVCNAQVGCPLAIGSHSVVTNGNIYTDTQSKVYGANGSRISSAPAPRTYSGSPLYNVSRFSTSPSGNRVAFVADQTQNGDYPIRRAYVAKGDLTGAVQVAQVDGTTTTLEKISWSPDGQQIALAYYYPASKTGAIRLIKPDGSGNTLVSNTTINGYYDSIGWISANQLALHANNFVGNNSSKQSTCTIQTDGSGKSCTDLTAYYYDMKVSPDGTQLLFAHSVWNYTLKLDERNLYISDIDGQNMRQVTHQTGSDGADLASWSPDGLSIIYRTMNSKTGNTNVNVINRDGSNNRILVANLGYQPTWLPQLKCQSNPFTDVTTTTPFCVEIDWAVTNGIATGYSDGSFKPTNLVTRGDMAAFMYNRARLSDPSLPANPTCSTQPFKDIPTSHPLCGQIKWIKDKGITTGYPDGTYQPANSINRDAMSAFLYRAEHPGQPEPTCTKAPFKDVSTSTQFCGVINWMAQQGITTGYTDGTFRPQSTVTRDAMMAFIYRTTVH